MEGLGLKMNTTLCMKRGGGGTIWRGGGFDHITLLMQGEGTAGDMIEDCKARRGMNADEGDDMGTRWGPG